jgi:hypothetical protein
MDHLMLKNNIADREKEEPRSPTNLEKGMIDTNDEEEITPIGRMCKRRNDKHQLRRTNHAMGYRKVKSRFQ